MDTSLKFALVFGIGIFTFLLITYWIKKWFREHHPAWGYLTIAVILGFCVLMISKRLNFPEFSECVQTVMPPFSTVGRSRN